MRWRDRLRAAWAALRHSAEPAARTLVLAPGDKLMVTTDRALTREQRDRLADGLAHQLDTREVIVLDGLAGVEFVVVSGWYRRVEVSEREAQETGSPDFHVDSFIARYSLKTD